MLFFHKFHQIGTDPGDPFLKRYKNITGSILQKTALHIMVERKQHECYAKYSEDQQNIFAGKFFLFLFFLNYRTHNTLFATFQTIGQRRVPIIPYDR